MKKFLTTVAVISILAAPVAMADTHMQGEMLENNGMERFDSLPEAKAKIVKDAFAKLKETNKADNEKIKTLRKEIKELMAKEKFDKDAYLAKNTEIRNLMQKNLEQRAKVIAELAPQLTVEERKTLEHKRMGGMKKNGKKSMDKKDMMDKEEGDNGSEE